MRNLPSITWPSPGARTTTQRALHPLHAPMPSTSEVCLTRTECSPQENHSRGCGNPERSSESHALSRSRSLNPLGPIPGGRIGRIGGHPQTLGRRFPPAPPHDMKGWDNTPETQTDLGRVETSPQPGTRRRETKPEPVALPPEVSLQGVSLQQTPTSPGASSGRPAGPPRSRRWQSK